MRHTSAFILAGLVLEKDVVKQLLREELMQESVTYQALKSEATEVGRAEGRAEGVQLVALNLLREGISPKVVAKVTGLSVEQVQRLESEEASDTGK